jgi:hypothetical protein
MTTKKTAGFRTEKGKAFRQLVLAVQHPTDRTLQSTTVRFPTALLSPFDKVATRMKTTRTAVVLMMVSAVVDEMAAEGSEEVRKLVPEHLVRNGHVRGGR